MVKLTRIIKDYEASGAVNALVNLFGFIDDHVFLTKSGEVGVVIRVQGRDYECLDGIDLNEITRRFEACVRSFNSSFRIYQYLIKRDGVRIPRQPGYGNPIVREAVNSRALYLEGMARDLYSIDTYFVVIYEGSRHSLGAAEKWQKMRPTAPVFCIVDMESTVERLDLLRPREILVRPFTIEALSRALEKHAPQFFGGPNPRA